MSKLFKSIKNGTIAELLVENGDSVGLHILDTDEEKIIASSTLKRWWKPYEDDWKETKEPTQPKEEPNIQPKEEIKELKEPEQPKKSKSTNKKEKVKEDFSDIHKHILDFVEEMKKEHNIILWVSDKTAGFHTLKKDGKIYMAFAFTKKSGVTLWMRSEAIEGICEYKHYNHAFDARISINTWTPETYDLLSKLHTASLNFQIAKNNKLKK